MCLRQSSACGGHDGVWTVLTLLTALTVLTVLTADKIDEFDLIGAGRQ
jgi:hypothetical protein